MRFPSNTLVAGLAAAGALAAGLLLAPPTSSAQDDVRYLLSQDQKPLEMTISGTALNPDGTPAAKMIVAILQASKKAASTGDAGEDGQAPPPELLQAKGAGKGQGRGKNSVYTTIGKGITDESGRFSIKAKVIPIGKGTPSVVVEIGDPGTTNWYRENHILQSDKAEADLGNLQLKPKVRR